MFIVKVRVTPKTDLTAIKRKQKTVASIEAGKEWLISLKETYTIFKEDIRFINKETGAQYGYNFYNELIKMKF